MDETCEEAIDDLSRELTAEIEAHRVTRQERDRLALKLMEVAKRCGQEASRAEKAEASRAELLRELRALVEDVDDRGLSAGGILNALDAFVCKHESQS